MAAESDYKPEAIIFVAKDMAEARRITREAEKLKSISQVQSLTELFPTDAEQRLRKAIDISTAFTQANYAQQIAELDRAGLSAKSGHYCKRFWKTAPRSSTALRNNYFPLDIPI